MLKASAGFGEFKVDFPVDDILELSLSRKAGEHSRFFIRGIATKEAAARVIEEFDGTQTVSLSVKDGESVKPRFTGIVTSCVAKHRGDVHEIAAEAMGLTFLLDVKKNRRSFQNAEMTHERLAKAVISSHSDADLILNGNDGPIGDMFVQYEETDWEFLKRVAGDISLKLIPADEHKDIRFYVGLPEKGKPHISMLDKAPNEILDDYTITEDPYYGEEYQDNKTSAIFLFDPPDSSYMIRVPARIVFPELLQGNKDGLRFLEEMGLPARWGLDVESDCGFYFGFDDEHGIYFDTSLANGMVLTKEDTVIIK
jgi:hypothetical protein